MFVGLLNRVKKDLVRARLQCVIWSPINGRQGQWDRPAKLLRVYDQEEV